MWLDAPRRESGGLPTRIGCEVIALTEFVGIATAKIFRFGGSKPYIVHLLPGKLACVHHVHLLDMCSFSAKYLLCNCLVCQGPQGLAYV